MNKDTNVNRFPNPQIWLLLSLPVYWLLWFIFTGLSFVLIYFLFIGLLEGDETPILWGLSPLLTFLIGLFILYTGMFRANLFNSFETSEAGLRVQVVKYFWPQWILLGWDEIQDPKQTRLPYNRAYGMPNVLRPVWVIGTTRYISIWHRGIAKRLNFALFPSALIIGNDVQNQETLLEAIKTYTKQEGNHPGPSPD